MTQGKKKEIIMAIMKCALTGSLIDSAHRVKNDIKVVSNGNLKNFAMQQELTCR